MTHEEIVRLAVAHATSLGVALDVESDGDRLMFAVDRRDAPKGRGAQAIAELVRLADEADVELALDVAFSEPALVRYYWRFGFRMHDGTPEGENADLQALCEEIAAHLAAGRPRDDFGVTTMWRNRWTGPLGEGAQQAA